MLCNIMMIRVVLSTNMALRSMRSLYLALRYNTGTCMFSLFKSDIWKVDFSASQVKSFPISSVLQGYTTMNIRLHAFRAWDLLAIPVD